MEAGNNNEEEEEIIHISTNIRMINNTIYFDPIQNAISLIKEENSSDLGNLLEEETLASNLLIDIFANIPPPRKLLRWIITLDFKRMVSLICAFFL